MSKTALLGPWVKRFLLDHLISNATSVGTRNGAIGIPSLSFFRCALKGA